MIVIEISDAEANIVASRKLKFWLRRIACAVAKTAKTMAKAMCVINSLESRSNKLIGILESNTKRNMVQSKR